MKEIVFTAPTIYTTPDQLTGREIVAYLSNEANVPKLLVSLTSSNDSRDNPGHTSFGFVSLAYPSGEVAFKKEGWNESVEAALRSGRKLVAFDSYPQFLKWAGQQQFKGKPQS
jgi:hypothetical protein